MPKLRSTASLMFGELMKFRCLLTLSALLTEIRNHVVLGFRSEAGSTD